MRFDLNETRSSAPRRSGRFVRDAAPAAGSSPPGDVGDRPSVTEKVGVGNAESVIQPVFGAKRKGNTFIDYLRHQPGSTAILAYSARARSGAPVAGPIAWGELKGFDNARAFSIGDAKRLLDRAKGKGLAGWGFAEQALPDL